MQGIRSITSRRAGDGRFRKVAGIRLRPDHPAHARFDPEHLIVDDPSQAGGPDPGRRVPVHVGVVRQVEVASRSGCLPAACRALPAGRR
jgi:hypothetical protein